MNILSMLARLEGALGCTNLTKQMVLIPQSRAVDTQAPSEINLVVGYNGSSRSQTALDLTLWIAHQTRLAMRQQVTVQVAYVLNLENECKPTRFSRQGVSGSSSSSMGYRNSLECSTEPVKHSGRKKSSSAVAELSELTKTQACQTDQFEEADRILWQARNLADEWRGSLKTHLRFGLVADQLRQVVQAESATLLLLGCDTPDTPIVRQLGSRFPCPVLGIPTAS